MPSKHRGQPQEMRALNAFIPFMRAHEHLQARLSGLLAAQGLTQAQFGVLETLWHLGPLRQSQLGEKLLCSKPNISELVRNLESSGLILRQRDPRDGRAQLVDLSPAGLARVSKAFPAFKAFLLKAFAPLAGPEQERLRSLSRRLGKHLQALDA